MEGAHVSHGVLVQQSGRENHKEVGLEGLPVQAAQTAYGDLQVLSTDAQAQTIAHLYTQIGGKPLLHGHRVQLAVAPPLPGEQLVAVGQGRGPGEVRLALPRRVALRFDRQRLPVYGDDSPAQHGVKLLAANARVVQQRAHRAHLLGGQIEHEVVGRALGQLTLPALQQRAAQQGEQQQQHDGHTEHDKL